MEKEILSIREVAEYLGVKIGTAHIYIKREAIPVIRIGKKTIRVRRQDLLQWVESHMVSGVESGII